MENAKRAFTDIIEAWDWLRSHPAFDFTVYEGVLGASDPLMWRLVGSKDVRYRLHDNTFAESLSIEYLRINSEEMAVDLDANPETGAVVLLEAGGPVEDESIGRRYRTSHDPKLDCTGPTFEVALLRMAGRVLEEYGDYEPDPIIVE
jgi:hypothetical protein